MYHKAWCRGVVTMSSNLRLTTVAFADVAGYSRLMADDSAWAISKWSELRDGVLIAQMEGIGGRLASTAGDAVLIEFKSATDAISWAMKVQEEIRALPADKRSLQIRIGINAADVVENGNDLVADGVNIAARIHQLAAPGEIVVTQIVREIVRGRLGISFRDLGAPPLKNIDRPVHVFAVEERLNSPELVRPHLSWSSRPTIAVLPFRDQADNPSTEYFGEGITEDIIAGISRSRALFVIARNSSLHVADSNKSLRDIAGALGVKYLLSGSIRRQGPRLRISTDLMNVDQNRTIWAERYDGTTQDVFDFQDRIVSSIVAALEPKVLSAEAARLGSRPTESMDAYDCVLRGLSEIYRFDANSMREVLTLFENATKLDPGYAQAHAYVAWSLNFLVAEGHSEDPAGDRLRAIASARKAVELDPEDAVSLSIRAHILGLLEGDPHGALDLLEDALSYNGNLPLAWGLSAASYAYLGNGDEARERLLNVWRLTPYDPLNFFFWTAGGLAEFVAGNYDEAVHYLQKARHAKPNFIACLRLLAAALAMQGDKEAAAQVAEELLKIEPIFSVRQFMLWYPLKSPEARERLVLGLSSAGLPQ